MPRRRPFGYVFRRRDARRGVAGSDGYRPGWYVRLRVGGRETTRFAGTDRATAVAFAARVARESDRRDLLDETPVPESSFASFADVYLRHVARTMTPRAAASRVRIVKNILVPWFGEQRIADLRRPDLQRFLASRTDVCGATRNRDLTAISAMLRHAIDLGLLEENPASRVKRAKETRFPLGLVSDAQQGQLIGHLDEPLKTYFLTLLDSGMRMGEAIDLAWDDVDFAAGTLHIRWSKAKRPRIVAMTARLREALLRLYARRLPSLHGPGAVFPGAKWKHFQLPYSWRRSFKDAAKKIGAPSLRIHDLRHMHAVNLVRRGVDLPTVQAVLGHTSLLSTLRYAEYADGSAAFRAARALDALHAAGNSAAAGRS